jgi:NADH:ubiquinone oxidoreductase subunit K
MNLAPPLLPVRPARARGNLAVADRLLHRIRHPHEPQPVKTVIGIEILAKAVTLNLVWAGHFQNRVALGEALAVIAIAIDAVVVAILMSLVVTAHRHYGTGPRALTRLKVTL